MPPEGQPSRKKKKVDYEALNSPFMRIPGMKVEPVRALIDIGVTEVYELSGRAPEVLFEEWKYRHGHSEAPADLLPYFRIAVYYAETPDPDPRKLNKYSWQ